MEESTLTQIGEALIMLDKSPACSLVLKKDLLKNLSIMMQGYFSGSYIDKSKALAILCSEEALTKNHAKTLITSAKKYKNLPSMDSYNWYGKVNSVIEACIGLDALTKSLKKVNPDNSLAQKYENASFEARHAIHELLDQRVSYLSVDKSEYDYLLEVRNLDNTLSKMGLTRENIGKHGKSTEIKRLWEEYKTLTLSDNKIYLEAEKAEKKKNSHQAKERYILGTKVTNGNAEESRIKEGILLELADMAYIKCYHWDKHMIAFIKLYKEAVIIFDSAYIEPIKKEVVGLLKKRANTILPTAIWSKQDQVWLLDEHLKALKLKRSDIRSDKTNPYILSIWRKYDFGKIKID